MSLCRTILNSESSRYSLVQASAAWNNDAKEVAGHYFLGDQIVCLEDL